MLLELKQMPKDSDDVDIVRLMAVKLAALLGFELGDHRPGRDYY